MAGLALHSTRAVWYGLSGAQGPQAGVCAGASAGWGRQGSRCGWPGSGQGHRDVVLEAHLKACVCIGEVRYLWVGWWCLFGGDAVCSQDGHYV